MDDALFSKLVDGLRDLILNSGLSLDELDEAERRQLATPPRHRKRNDPDAVAESRRATRLAFIQARRRM